MAQAERILYQFPLSHFCEKSRWCLDHKQLPYEAHNLIPGLHRLTTQRKAHSNTVPLLKDGPNWVPDSTAIALYLDGRYPELPLVARDPGQKQQILQWDQHAVALAVDVRRWLYIQMEGHPLVRRVILGDHRWLRRTEAVSWPLIIGTIKKHYGIHPDRAETTLKKIWYRLDPLEQALLANGGRYLIGTQLSLADISAASTLAPLLGIAETPWVPEGDEVLPAAVLALRDQLVDRPLGQYVLRLYQTERQARVDWHGQ